MLDVEALSEMMAGIISEEVAKAVAPLQAEIAELKAREPEKGEPGEPGQPGTSVDPEAVRQMVRDQVEEAMKSIPAPKDGEPGKDAAGIVDALKDQGELVLTLQDGRVIRTGIRDGKDGEPGAPGFGLDDFDVEAIDERTIKLKFERDGVCHSYELEFPVQVYRGVYKEGEEYKRGDVVTWGGSQWHCDSPTKEKPGTANWTLAVKKGRDGKDARNG